MECIDKNNKINPNKEIDKLCEECKEDSESVQANLIMYGYKICDRCAFSSIL